MSAQEGNPDSSLAFTRKLAAARHDHPALREGSLTFLQGALAFVREGGGVKIVGFFNLGAGTVNFDLPGDVTPLDVGTGRASLSERRLPLGPFSAFFGRLYSR